MTLARTQFGTTGWDVSAVGFGAWAISGTGWRFSWGPQDDGQAVATIRRAVDAGINWIDTAAVYGYGHSEELVGKALRDIPSDDRPYVFTKCGLVWDVRDPLAAPRKIARPQSIVREVDDSLRRLGVDCIDLYQIHWPGDGLPLSDDAAGDAGPATPVEEYWAAMAELKRAGKVRAIGLSNHDVKQLEAAEGIAHVDALQPHFSALERTAAPEIAWADAHDTAVIVYSPMESGLLTGTWSAQRVADLPDTDWRRTSRLFTTDLNTNVALADALRPVAARHGVAVGALAVAWTLAWPGVTGAIVGARSPDQIDDWLPAASLVLTAADLDEIADAIDRTGAGQGPARPSGR